MATVNIRIPGTAFNNTAFGIVVDASTGPTFTNPWIPGQVIFPIAGDGVNDAFYIGSDDKFYRAWIDLSTIGIGTYTLTWEYSDAVSTFAATANPAANGPWDLDLKVATGVGNVTFDVPTDWVKGTVDGVSKYWIRALTDAGTMTTEAIAEAIRVGETYQPTKMEVSGGADNVGTPFPRGKARIPISWLDDSATGAAGNSFIKNTSQEISARALQVTAGGIAFDSEHYSDVENHAKASMLRLYQAGLCVVEFDGIARSTAQIVSTDGS